MTDWSKAFPKMSKRGRATSSGTRVGDKVAKRMGMRNYGGGIRTTARNWGGWTNALTRSDKAHRRAEGSSGAAKETWGSIAKANDKLATKHRDKARRHTRTIKSLNQGTLRAERRRS